MPTDFRDGKARASASGTIYDYVYPCPMDRGVFERWGITASEFNDAIRAHQTDDAIAQWFRARVSPERTAVANEWLLSEKASNLDRQDREERAS